MNKLYHYHWDLYCRDTIIRLYPFNLATHIGMAILTTYFLTVCIIWLMANITYISEFFEGSHPRFWTWYRAIRAKKLFSILPNFDTLDDLDEE